MAWGRSGATGLDDLCQRLRSNDPTLTSLTILKHRKFDAVEVQKLCVSLADNTVLTELYASNHAVPPDVALDIGQMVCRNGTLTALCIGDSSFGDDGVAALVDGLLSGTSLRSLDLENKNVSVSGCKALCRILAENGVLQSLSLARNPLGDEGAAALSASPWKALQHLDLRACGLGAGAVASLAGGSETCCLTSLDLSDNLVSGLEAGPALAQLLAKCSVLKELKLRGCQLEDPSVEALAQGLGAHRALQLLDLSGNQCGEAGGAALAASLASNSSLRQLDLGSNPGITAATVAALAAAISSRGEGCSLTHLDLTGTKLQGDAGLATLEALSACHLRQLCLLGSRIGNEGAKKLVTCLEAGGFGALQELSLSACDMDFAGGLQPLLNTLLSGKAPTLKVLECGANPACQGDDLPPLILALRESRPGLRVHWNASDEANKSEGAAAGASMVQA